MARKARPTSPDWTAEDPQIVARDLVKIYRLGGGEIGALQGVSVEIARGEYLAVTGASDLLAVDVSANKVVLKPGQELTLTVGLKRRPDYDKTVTLDVQLRQLNTVYANPLPPGVTMVDGKSKTLLGSGNAGTIVLKAAADAPECTDVPICVQGFVPVNFVVKIGYASEPILVSVKK